MSRSYLDGCGIARALDVVGRRWALLVVRELLFGPLRFSDLQRALPGASTNMLSDRLAELVGDGVLRRRRLPPPAGTAVYELTGLGRDLEPVLDRLGAWGLNFARPEPAHLSATSMMLFLQGAAQPPLDTEPASIQLTLDDRVFYAHLTSDSVTVDTAAPPVLDAELECSPASLNNLLGGATDLATAEREGAASTSGDRSCIQALIDAVTAHRPT